MQEGYQAMMSWDHNPCPPHRSDTCSARRGVRADARVCQTCQAWQVRAGCRLRRYEPFLATVATQLHAGCAMCSSIYRLIPHSWKLSLALERCFLRKQRGRDDDAGRPPLVGSRVLCRRSRGIWRRVGELCEFHLRLSRSQNRPSTADAGTVRREGRPLRRHYGLSQDLRARQTATASHNPKSWLGLDNGQRHLVSRLITTPAAAFVDPAVLASSTPHGAGGTGTGVQGPAARVEAALTLN